MMYTDFTSRRLKIFKDGVREQAKILKWRGVKHDQILKWWEGEVTPYQNVKMGWLQFRNNDSGC